MNKKHIFNLAVVIAVIAGMAAFSATDIGAWFSDSESVNNVDFATGFADLKLRGDGSGNWYDSASDHTLGIDLPECLAPGYEADWNNPDGIVYLGNFGTVDLIVTATIRDYTESKGGLQDNVQMALAWSGNAAGTGFHTLRWWRSNSRTLFDGNDIEGSCPAGSPNDSKQVRIYLKMPGSVGNDMASQTANFDLVFDAVQEH